jgi:hypothetical protein
LLGTAFTLGTKLVESMPQKLVEIIEREGASLSTSLVTSDHILLKINPK